MYFVAINSYNKVYNISLLLSTQCTMLTEWLQIFELLTENVTIK